MAIAFISYSREDAAIAELLRLNLQAHSIETFVDTENIEAGSKWRDSIDNKIEASDVLIVAVTEASLKSYYVQYEWGFAVGRQTKVLPLVFGPVELPGPLSRYQSIDCTSLRAVDWAEVAQIVHSSAESKAAKEAEKTVARDIQDQVEKLDGVIETLLDIPDLSAAIADLKSKLQAFKKQSETAKQRTHKIFREILWVDDYPTNNVYEQQMFSKLNYNITTALSTDEAMALIEQDAEKFDVIISDMGRREGPREGYVLLERLRNSGIETPYLIYAGSDDPRHEAEAIRRGAQGSTNRPAKLRDMVVSLA
ncbi:MAG: TIR domain-containing protein [Woeseiaceae bacterium]|jgi:CheY-like chemotaxis protein